MNKFKDTQLPKSKAVEAPIPERPRYPSLHFPLKFIPEAEKWSMDKDYELMLQVKVSSITKSKNKGQEEDTGSVDFDITGIKVDDEATDSKKEEKEENSVGSYKERG